MTTTAVVSLVALAGGVHALAQPSDVDPLPRFLTDAERSHVALFPIQVPEPSTPPPTGPVTCPGEYAPMDGIIIAWQGPSQWLSILSTMARHVTTTAQSNVYCVVFNASVQTSATTVLQSAGVNMSRVKFVIKPLNSIWCRDYGPRYIYQGGVRAIVDHTYNRPRPDDDTLPVAFATFKNHARYEVPLIHGGGNYHLSSLGDSHATELIANENPTLTRPQIVEYWRQYQNVQTAIRPAFPTFVDLTQHIDMWMQVHADRGVMISDWPSAQNSIQDQICDQTASALAATGYAVTRIPAFSVPGGPFGDTHYTYTNVVMCNSIVMIPSYTHPTVAPSNAAALAAWQAAAPGKTIIQVPAQDIVDYAGVLHCIVMHVPVNSGGENPVVYVVSPNAPAAFPAGATLPARWVADDDNAVVGIDVGLSIDGGATFPIALASGVPHTGQLNWTVPATIYTNQGVVRITARDAQGRTAQETSDGLLTLGTCVGDCETSTGFGVLDIFDFLCFQNRYAASDPYACDCDTGTGPGVCDIFDFLCFQNAFADGCP